MVKHTQKFVGKLPTNCLSVFDHFVILALKGLSVQQEFFMNQQKELFITEMNLFKNELLTSLKHNTKFHI